MSRPLKLPENYHAYRLMVSSFLLGCLVCTMVANFSTPHGDNGVGHANSKATINGNEFENVSPAKLDSTPPSKSLSLHGWDVFTHRSRISLAQVGQTNPLVHPTLLRLGVRLQI